MGIEKHYQTGTHEKYAKEDYRPFCNKYHSCNVYLLFCN